MTEINRVYGTGRLNALRQDVRLPAAASKPGSVKTQDQVEISEAAQLLSKMSEIPEIRTNKVEQVRQAILRGDYETPDKIAIVAGRILQELSSDLEA